MSRRFPGRFNTPDVGAVYVSRQPETALDEFVRRASRDGVSLTDMHPRSIFEVDLYLQEAVDLTAAGQLDVWGLTPEDLVSEDMTRCREVAAVAAEHGAEAIQWASASGAGESIAVFVENLRAGSHVEVVRTFDLTREMLRAIEQGTRVRGILSLVGLLSTEASGA